MIIAYTGLSGSGKSYHMAQVALDLIRRGVTVFSRSQIEGAFPFEDEREMLRMNDCHIFFDEWHQDHNAKEWYTMDKVVRHIITQQRKYSMTIHWSAQHWMYMDSFIRRNTELCWKHYALFRNLENGESRIGLHRAKLIDGIEEELKHKNPPILAKKWLRISKKVYDAYDSYKPIMLDEADLSDEEMQLIKDPYTRSRIKLTPNHSEDQHPYLPRKKSGLNSEDVPDDDYDGINRHDEPDELRASPEIVNP